MSGLFARLAHARTRFTATVALTYNRHETAFCLMTEIPDGLGRCLLLASVFVVTVALLTGTGTVVAQSAPDCSTVSYDGDGTEDNPYEVRNVDQLQCIKDQDLASSYELVSDINASETASWNNGKGFDPIGDFNVSRDTEFNGTFDGRNHNITNLTIDRYNESEDDRDRMSEIGLFGAVGSLGTVTKVSVVEIDINSSGVVGGLVGTNSGTIDEAYSNGSIGGSRAGGLAGSNSRGTINESYANVSVNGSDVVGGLVGGNFKGTIKRSYATGSVDGTEWVGGLVGVNRGIVEHSYATGSVNGSRLVGGLVGRNTGGTIRKSYARGSVNGSKEVGGLVGSSLEGTIKETYATGHVGCSAVDCSGVFGLGGVDQITEITESYWDINATGQSHPNFVGTGLTTAGMTGEAARGNMTGFDFTNTWRTVPGDYPVLAWQTSGGGDGAESEGLPGFTVVTAVLALSTVVAAAVRRRTE